jgi:hypothetical protein
MITEDLYHLNPEIGHPSMEIFVKFLDDLIHGKRIVPPSKLWNLFLEFEPLFLA